ncbi:hypothetical protein J8F10_13665 [Gemmata sp. G18]|uniref:Virion structural protein n=1 Tax=Gemmata palustris TaxID=2822762 RepID=A0ABS5BRM3_9BACT|nr:hypothetical protein [Gemmata palustris]MBP3956333.1 hypothetical protein [Gemmata palustris]
MPILTYLEEVADVSPASASFTNQSQSCAATYILRSPTLADLRNSIIDLLGSTGTAVADGRIQRILPARHPLYQWMFADSCSPQGVGARFTVETPSPGPGSPIIPYFPRYTDYRYRVSFSPRPYNSWQDHDVIVTSAIGFDKGGSAYSYTYATEWMRFTTFEQTPANQFVTAQQGQMVFRVGNTVSGVLPPNEVNYQDAPRLWLPDSIVKCRWYQVPYRYLTSGNSYLTKFIGHINQNDFGYLNGENRLEPYRAGSLLYLGATPTAVYTPPIPDPGLLAFNVGDGFARSKLCDLELNFLYTARTLGSPTGYAPDFSAVNRNWIVAGHNLQPWLTTRKFYHVSTYDPAAPADHAKWYPTYNSFPFELLFTDPDAGNSPKMEP